VFNDAWKNDAGISRLSLGRVWSAKLVMAVLN